MWQVFAQVLAEDSQSEGGDVSQRTGGDPGRDRTGRVPKGDGTAVPPDRQVRVQSALPGGRACALLLEQRVHYVVDFGELAGHSADHVPVAVPQLEDALEQDDPRAHLQRAQALHGDEPEALRRVQQELQAGETNVSACCMGTECVVMRFRGVSINLTLLEVLRIPCRP